MVMKDIVGVAVAVLVLAGLTVAIVNGDKTAAIVGEVGKSFSSVVTAATSTKAA